MPPALAALIYAVGIVALFRLDRDATPRTSPALWLPIAWLALGASRSVGQWLDVAPTLGSPDQYLDGSPLDALIFTGLEAAAVLVLMVRHPRAGAFLRANGPLLVFFLYCALSVLWSEYPMVAFKRWVKAVGNVIMVLVVLTDPNPRAAVKQLLARTGFLLLPLSVLIIKYYPELGRGFDGWTGRAYNMGVALDKNGLGVICLLFGLGAVWRVVGGLAERPPAARSLVAHAATLAIALWLFSMANSATSLGGFLAGIGLIALTSWGPTRRPAIVHAVVVGIVALCVIGVLVETDMGLVQVMGRDATLTTRTQLWTDVLRVPVNPLIGTGFESFWLGERARALWDKHWWRPNQAHNGYLEVFLNSGWIGVVLLGVLMGWGYRTVMTALRQDPQLGRLRLALFVAAVLYNLTEAAFKVMHPMWIAFLLAVTVIPPAAVARRPGRARPSRLRSGVLARHVGHAPNSRTPRRSWSAAH